MNAPKRAEPMRCLHPLDYRRDNGGNRNINGIYCDKCGADVTEPFAPKRDERPEPVVMTRRECPGCAQEELRCDCPYRGGAVEVQYVHRENYLRLAAKLEAAESALAIQKDDWQRMYDEREAAERGQRACEEAYALANEHRARLTRELADLKSEMRDDEVLNDEVCRQFDKMKTENAALREVVEAVKWHIVWEDSVYGIASGSVSRTWQAVLDAIAALDAGKEGK